MDQQLNLLIVEDNPRDREYLCSQFSGYEISACINGQEAIEAFSRRKITNVISDMQMPKLNGVEFAREIWRQHPHTRILFWSQFDDEMYLRALGKIVPAETVYGYVLKSNTAEVLNKAAHAVFNECQCWIDPKVRPVQARMQKPDGLITDVEHQALIDISLGLTDNAIAERRYLSRRGVQNRLKSLYAKLSDGQADFPDDRYSDYFNLRARAIAIALSRGLINAHELTAEEKRLQTWLQTRLKNQQSS